jgi:hypothetical protein
MVEFLEPWQSEPKRKHGRQEMTVTRSAKDGVLKQVHYSSTHLENENVDESACFDMLQKWTLDSCPVRDFAYTYTMIYYVSVRSHCTAYHATNLLHRGSSQSLQEPNQLLIAGRRSF